MTMSELQQLQDILNRLPSHRQDRTVRDPPAAGLQDGLIEINRFNDSTTAQPQPLPRPPSPSHIGHTGSVSDDFAIDYINWQDGFPAEQLVNFAESMDLSALDWLSAET